MVNAVYTLPEPLASLAPHVRELVTKFSWGPILWKQLHDRPAETGGELSREAEWMEGFRAAIICDACRYHFSEYMLRYPPDFTNTRTYFRWTWGAHNSVRFRIGQPRIPWQEAWGEP